MTSTSANSPSGSRYPLSGGLGLFLCVVILGIAVYLAYRTLTTAPTPDAHGMAMTFMCSETRKTFDYTMKEGESEPVDSPYSKKKTGYQAEACYWTKDGKRKTNPDYVILNSRLGKEGDTICPVCGRVVTPHNPLPPANTPMATN